MDGQDEAIGGTSAVAPLWAGLAARCNEALGKSASFLDAVLYTDPTARASLRDVTSGNTGTYQAGPGWDACTGLGSP